MASAESGDTSDMLGLADRALLERLAVMRYAGLSYGGDRDYYATLGYNRNPDPKEYRARWERGGIAETINDAPAEASWRDRPKVIDEASEGADDEPVTDFEKDVQTLFDDLQLLHYLERWDKALGMGEYGLLMLGLAESDTANIEDIESADAPSLDQAAEEDTYDIADLAYFSVFTQESVADVATVTNPMHERYGLPQRYDLELDAGDGARTETVHYTRVLHAAEGLLDNEVYGKPRLRPVLNRLDDREKILGGSAEAYWRSADRRLQLNYEGDAKPQDADDVAEEAEEMIHGLRSVITTRNTELTAIEGSDPDPTGALDKNTEELSGTVGIPKRILTGSERGELASTQDKATFAGRIAERQSSFCEPMMLRPLIDRLVFLGIVSEPTGDGYEVEWEDIFELNELERAELAKTWAEALKNAAPMGDPGSLATDAEIREAILQWDPEKGEESSIPEDPELVEEDDEGDITDEEPGDVDDMEDVLEQIEQPVAPDGGEP